MFRHILAHLFSLLCMPLQYGISCCNLAADTVASAIEQYRVTSVHVGDMLQIPQGLRCMWRWARPSLG